MGTLKTVTLWRLQKKKERKKAISSNKASACHQEGSCPRSSCSVGLSTRLATGVLHQNMLLSLSCICVWCYRAIISCAAGCIREDLFCVNTCFTSSRSHQQMATISPSHFKQNMGWYKYFADHFNVCDQTSVCRPLLQLNLKWVLHVGSGWK